MTQPSHASHEEAANLLDQVQMDIQLFTDESEPVQPDVMEDVAAPLPMPQVQETKVEQPAEEATPAEPQPVKPGGFSALIQHLKAEAMRHEAQARQHQAMRRYAA